MILAAFAKAVGQIGDPRFRRVLLLGIVLTIALLVAACIVALWLIRWLVGDDASLPFIGPVTWLNDAAGVGSLFVMAVLSVFLMVPVASAITSLFLEDVADAVEARHYPGLPPARRVPVWDTVRDSLGFLGVLVGANLLALILYLIFAPAAPFIFMALNGYLLGREYFTLAAMRRVGRSGALALRRKHAARIWVAGAFMAVLLFVPLMNLLVPILGAATFTHLFHRLWRAGPSG